MGGMTAGSEDAVKDVKIRSSSSMKTRRLGFMMATAGGATKEGRAQTVGRVAQVEMENKQQ